MSMKNEFHAGDVLVRIGDVKKWWVYDNNPNKPYYCLEELIEDEGDFLRELVSFDRTWVEANFVKVGRVMQVRKVNGPRTVAKEVEDD